MWGIDRKEPKKEGGKSTTTRTNKKKSLLLFRRERPSNKILKRWFLLVINAIAIVTSILTIYSCKFFSYKEVDVFDDAYTSQADISYEPFEYLPRAGVGLFSYFMGDPTGKGVMMNDQMCFYYCDEYTDYQWLSSNNEETGNLDKWVLARVCSIMAPIFGLLACVQMMIETVFEYKIPLCGDGMYLKTQLLLIATFFQIGTFVVVFAPPIMKSSAEEDEQQQFCFSETSNVRCKLDTGSMFSMTSTMIYLLLAHSAFYTRRPSVAEKIDLPKEKEGVEPDTEESSVSDLSDSNSESQHSMSQPSKSHSKTYSTAHSPQNEEEEEDDDASVFSTLIQYFGRNYNSEDMEDEQDIESDSHSSEDNSLQQEIIEYSQQHVRYQKQERPDDERDGCATKDVSRSSAKARRRIWEKKSSIRDIWEKKSSIRDSRVYKKHSPPSHSGPSNSGHSNSGSSGSKKFWETESSSTLRELGIKLKPLVPYSGIKNNIKSPGSF